MNYSNVVNSSILLPICDPYITVPPSLANPTIQGLLSSPGALSLPQGQLLTTTEGIQIIAVNNPGDLAREGQIWQVLHPDMTIIAVNNDQAFEIEPKQEDKLGTVHY